MNSKNLELALQVAEKCIGFDLASMGPNKENIGISLDGKNRPMSVNTTRYPKIDINKKLKLTNKEIEILHSHNIYDKDIKDGYIEIGISDMDDNIIIVRTDKRSWMRLAGREWHLNRTTLDWDLVRMS